MVPFSTKSPSCDVNAQSSLLVLVTLLVVILLLVLQENLQKWLTDEKARDQFVIRAGSDTEVLWNDTRQLKPEPVYKRPVSAVMLITDIYLLLVLISLAGRYT